MDLILKDTFELSGDKRINTMKLRPNPDGSIQIWVKNGKTGRHAAFRLQADTQKELMVWLQCNIK